jgi:hypothetical protein
VRDIVASIQRFRTVDTPFDVVIAGHTDDADHTLVEQYREAGATWWLEDLSPWSFGWPSHGPWPMGAMQARIRRGPPQTG